eukprot:CAMPEP_0175969960 /NCGR_PEP_ID=MMETSP0108-20121206/40773_1 /TAXON_ID=195067 ORGANISM="Goniomonas pacifica, Strain CCMP1869" /NCGR_SAMPLE_ID=MMETSP0108 /ASSEMBLY_ACC=CAM_ASM_000204 /LENGTH=59 /DNA_ID=CAMNT_0017298843 /DNA_START=82 /DNA_END=258 /DNA_ORIENTATION=+
MGPTPCPRVDFASVMHDGRLIVFGGAVGPLASDVLCSNSLWRLDLVGHLARWTAVDMQG